MLVELLELDEELLLLFEDVVLFLLVELFLLVVLFLLVFVEPPLVLAEFAAYRAITVILDSILVSTVQL